MIAPATRGPASGALREIFAQDDRSIVERVASTVEQGHCPTGFDVEDGLPGIGICTQLAPVSTAKFAPSFHPVVEPLPQLRAWGNCLHPRDRRQSLLGHASRPQTLHQDPPTIPPRGRLIRALDLEHAALPP